MNASHGYLTVERLGRAIKIQRLNDQTYFTALRTMGVNETLAQALTARLITLPMKKEQVAA